MPLSRFALMVTLFAGLAACAPTADPDGLTGGERRAVTAAPQVAQTTARMQLLAPQCIRFWRGQPIDTAAMAAGGFTEINVLNPAARGFRSGSGRDRVNVTFLPRECNVGGPNYILEGGTLPDAVGAALAPLGFAATGARGTYAASDMSVRLGYPQTGRGTPNITLRR